MKHHVNQTLKILDDLREAHAEIERLRYDNESLRKAIEDALRPLDLDGPMRGSVDAAPLRKVLDR